METIVAVACWIVLRVVPGAQPYRPSATTQPEKIYPALQIPDGEMVERPGDQHAADQK